MTDHQNLLDKFADPTRRSVLKKGAAATAGLGLTAASSGSAAAQDDDEVLEDQEWDKAIMPAGQFQPRSRFIITSPVLQWNPRVEEIRDNVWSEYNTRAIRYLNSNEHVLFWQAEDAEVPNFNQEAGYVVDAEGDTFQDGNPQPEIFRMHSESALFGDSGYMTVNFTPVGEDEEDQYFNDEGDIFFEDEPQEGEPVGLDDVPGNFTDTNDSN
ncbi:hypothetical protein [Halomicrobium salinisoli]|uniref:hypothetical protein n=1 Tax=Halomicrobium salinisoli TaxID=2878391 RepID=UPI001CF05351|nr:hypothetical protein [Halomicrobium salinisoli]